MSTPEQKKWLLLYKAALLESDLQKMRLRIVLASSRLATYKPEPIGHLLFAVKEVSHDLQTRPQGPRS
jgi:hypothetical protein